jgi:hypothetical protein
MQLRRIVRRNLRGSRSRFGCRVTTTAPAASGPTRVMLSATMIEGGYQLRAHKILVARRAPSAMASNFAQQIDAWPTRGPRPQSVPASTFSRQTNFA